MSVAASSSARARYLGPGRAGERDRAPQHRRATARRGPRRPRSPLTSHGAGQRGAAQPSGGGRRPPPAAAAAAPRPGPGPAPPGAAAAPGTGRAPLSATTGRTRRSCGQRPRLSSGPGPAPQPRPRARLRSPGHVRPPPPARASPRRRHPAPAPAATSPGAPGAANRSPRSRAPPGGAPPPRAAGPNRRRRPQLEPRPRGPAANRTGSKGAPTRRRDAPGSALAPASDPLPGDVTRKLPIAALLPPAASQSEEPKQTTRATSWSGGRDGQWQLSGPAERSGGRDKGRRVVAQWAVQRGGRRS